MTREEALIQLRIGPGINEDVSEEYNDAVDMAIKALETQPSERTEERTETHACDCISRKGHWIGERKIGSEWKDVTVYVNSEGNVMESVRCSECDEWLTGSDEYICGARYCPMCGAKMQEVQE